MWCNQQSVDAQFHFQREIETIDAQIREIQASSKKNNLGFAIISFKSKDCVTDTIEEIDLVKQNLMNDKKVMKLGV